jgi:hypothetical protein
MRTMGEQLVLDIAATCRCISASVIAPCSQSISTHYPSLFLVSKGCVGMIEGGCADKVVLRTSSPSDATVLASW